MSNDRLASFLSEQSQVGSTLEQNVEFSVDLVSAHTKLGKYVFPRQNAWILKFVQAATEAYSSELQVRLARDKVEIEFQPDLFQELTGLQRNLASLKPGNLAEDHLFGGLLALKTLPGELYLEQSGERWFPLDERGIVTGESRSKTLSVVYKPTRLSFWERLRHRIRFTADLQEELNSYCYASPVRLILDNRPLEQGESDLPLLSGLIKGNQGAHLDLYGQIERDTGKKDRTFCTWGGKRPPHAAYAVQIRLSEKRSAGFLCVDWIRSGVVVKRERRAIKGSLPLLVRILVPTRGLKFDASGFAIKECEEATSREREAATYLDYAVKAVKGNLMRGDKWALFIGRHYPHYYHVDPNKLYQQLDECLNSRVHRPRRNPKAP